MKDSLKSGTCVATYRPVLCNVFLHENTILLHDFKSLNLRYVQYFFYAYDIAAIYKAQYDNSNKVSYTDQEKIKT